MSGRLVHTVTLTTRVGAGTTATANCCAHLNGSPAAVSSGRENPYSYGRPMFLARIGTCSVVAPTIHVPISNTATKPDTSAQPHHGATEDRVTSVASAGERSRKYQNRKVQHVRATVGFSV